MFGTKSHTDVMQSQKTSRGLASSFGDYVSQKIDEIVEKIHFCLFELITNSMVVYFDRKFNFGNIRCSHKYYP